MALAGIPVSLIVTPVLYLVCLTVAHLIQLATPLPAEFWAIVDRAGRAVPLVADQIDRAIQSQSIAPLEWSTLGTIAAVLTIPGMVFMVLLWLWVRLLFRRAGTDGTLLRMKARVPSETDLEERQLVNLVGEMAIAAGVRPPQVRILDHHVPNAAALGRSFDDGTIVVTRGLLDTLSRDETQGVIAHLVGSVGNGDLRMASTLLSVWQTFGLLAIILAAPSAKGARARLWDTVKSIFRRRGHTETERVAILLATDDLDPGEGSSQGCLGLLVAPFMIAGATTQLLTSLGTWLFYGPLLTAAWRSRRFLADATAVQLTRNPNGIAHALQRIQREEVTFDGGATSAPLFLHWPQGSGAKGWPSLGKFHPGLATRIHRLEASGARRLRFSLEGPSPAAARGSPWFKPLLWLLMAFVYALMIVGFAAAGVGAALMMGLSFLFVGGALLVIHALFTNLPAIIQFITTDIPKIGKAILELIDQLRKA